MHCNICWGNKNIMLGIILVDHGSRLPESNEAFLHLVQKFAERSAGKIVEPAHMEIASPTIEEAFDKAVARGADEIVVHPFFLLPGYHLNRSIPDLCRKAARKHPKISWRITKALGESELILKVVEEIIRA